MMTKKIRNDVELTKGDAFRLTPGEYEAKYFVTLDGYIEHLQEMGYVSLINDNNSISFLLIALSEAGHVTIYNASLDRLELV